VARGKTSAKLLLFRSSGSYKNAAVFLATHLLGRNSPYKKKFYVKKERSELEPHFAKGIRPKDNMIKKYLAIPFQMVTFLKHGEFSPRFFVKHQDEAVQGSGSASAGASKQGTRRYLFEAKKMVSLCAIIIGFLRVGW